MQAATVVHCWSSPRSRSTALLYSFEARSDCAALDEPLYRRWLEENQGVFRPYTKELINGRPHQNSKPGDSFKWKREKDDMNTRIKSAVDKLSAMGTGGNGVIFLKHMAKHCSLYDFEKDIETHGSASITDAHEGIQIKHKHVILIRDPVSMLFSWDAASAVHNSNITPNELGIVQLLSIYSDVKSRTDGNGSICVLDSDDLASCPKITLEALCNDLDIPFTIQMLAWKDGPHECDGPWADWWYDDVHKSSGWSVGITQRYRTLDPKMLPALKTSLSAYNFFKHLTHGYRTRGPPPKEIYEDPRNEDGLIYIGAPGHGRLIPREFAGVSPWDSSVQGGDATWEGIRVYRGKILSLDKHLRRLFKSARALGFVNVHSKEEVVTAIFRCLAVNGMRDGAHMRLTLTRGEKCTSSMNPAFNVYGTTLIVLAEWKPTEGKTTYDNSKGISLITSSVRRNSPSTCDSKIHHNNMINNILPKIQANLAGAADALMLDVDGFVSETNATNVFMVDDGVLMTPHADHCLPGITRETVLMLAEEIGIKTQVRRISLAEFHSADEVFTTGTMGELTPVTMIDGRKISDGKKGVLTQRLQEVYSTLPERPGWATEIPPF